MRSPAFDRPPRGTADGGLTRRRLLGSAAWGLAAALGPSGRSFAAAPAEVEQVAADLFMLSGLGGNVLVLSTGEGQVLVDSGAVAFRDALLATLEELPGAGVPPTLFNTHWHLDQVGANAAIGRQGGTIVAHAKTRLHLANEYYLPGEDRYQPALPVDGHPSVSFHTTGARRVGGRSIEYGYLLEAHTDGDIYVHFPEANVMALGDAISPERDPVLDWFGGGWLGGRVDSLAHVLELSDAATRFVPSYGPIVGRAEVQAEHDMMLVLYERMVELVRQGLSAEDMLAQGIMSDLGREWSDPLRFVYAAHKGLWAHHNTLSHDVV